MTRRVVALTGSHLAISAVVLLGGLAGAPSGPLPTILGFAAAFALAGLAPLQVELGRHACTITLAEAILVAAAFRLHPAAVPLAAALGEAVACTAHRQRGRKLAFNVAATAGATSVAAVVLHVLAPNALDAAAPRTWLVVGAAVAVFATLNHASTAAVLATVDERPFSLVLTGSLGPAALATGVSAAAGLVGTMLVGLHPAAPLLLAPVVAAATLAVRQVARHQSAHLRFARLYAASRRTGGLQAFDDALATLADEARGLVTGTLAVCAAAAADGVWRAVAMGDDGIALVDRSAVDALRTLVAPGAAAEVRAADLPPALRALAPGTSAMVVAHAEGAAGVPGAVLGVVRQIEPDRNGDERASVLQAFAAHAGLVVANARLLGEVEASLAHQLDLHRQKDEFVAIVSHELRTPLTTMLGVIDTLRRGGGRFGEEQREKLHTMAERQGRQLQHLIEDLLLVAASSRSEAEVRVTAVDLRPLLEQLVRRLAPSVPGGLSLHVDDRLGPVVHTDEDRLRQVVVHLVDNAGKFAEGSPVAITVAPAPDGAFEVAVVDHGPGIAPADRERVFDRFVQLDSSNTRTRGGTGIGLALCRSVADLLGGSIRLEGTPGGGCTFTLRLADAAPAPAGPIRHPALAGAALPGGSNG